MLHDFLTLSYHITGTFAFPEFLCVLNVRPAQLNRNKTWSSPWQAAEWEQGNAERPCHWRLCRCCLDHGITGQLCSPLRLLSSLHPCCLSLHISDCVWASDPAEPRAVLRVSVTLVLPTLSLLLPMISSWSDNRCAIHWNPTPGLHGQGLSVDFVVSSHTLSTYYSATLSYMF